MADQQSDEEMIAGVIYCGKCKIHRTPVARETNGMFVFQCRRCQSASRFHEMHTIAAFNYMMRSQQYLDLLTYALGITEDKLASLESRVKVSTSKEKSSGES